MSNGAVVRHSCVADPLEADDVASIRQRQLPVDAEKRLHARLNVRVSQPLRGIFWGGTLLIVW